MNEEVNAYIEYLSRLSEIKRPKMPRISISAYTDNEYTNAIYEVMKDFKYIDDHYLTLQHLKGE